MHRSRADNAHEILGAMCDVGTKSDNTYRTSI